MAVARLGISSVSRAVERQAGFGETSALSLIWAVLELASRGWRGVTMTPRAVAHIERLRRRQKPLPTTTDANLTDEVVAA